jgi:hypothetical protein
MPRRGGLPQTPLLIADRLERGTQYSTDAGRADDSLFMCASSSSLRWQDETGFSGSAGRLRQRLGGRHDMMIAGTGAD